MAAGYSEASIYQDGQAEASSIGTTQQNRSAQRNAAHFVLDSLLKQRQIPGGVSKISPVLTNSNFHNRSRRAASDFISYSRRQPDPLTAEHDPAVLRNSLRSPAKSYQI